VDDFGALNDAPPDPEPTPAEAVPGVTLEPTPETAEDAPDASATAAAGEDLPPAVAEGAADAPAAAVPSAEVKGKCALGPFLSILVIECQLKCLNVNLCNV
jgi:hypothetical protein